MSQGQTHPTTSCQDEYDPNALSVEQALERMGADLTPVTETETLAVSAALGRVLAEPITSPMDIPGHRNSAMDGYAVRGEELPVEGMRRFRVVGTSWAGTPYSGTAGSGECVRIMTGAKLPDELDTVIMQEHVEVTGEDIEVRAGHSPGQNVRHPGEDVRAGDVVLEAGKRLMPAELGVLTSLGIGEVPVHRRVRVAFFSTGDELRSVGEALGEGDLYDSNRYTLSGMLRRLGVEVIDLGIVRDRSEDVDNAFREAAEVADVVVTSGGVSVGEADFVTETLSRLGEVGFWKIAMKPGRPLAFGRVGDARFFGLPGNPVSVMVTFYQFVQPALRRLAGEPFVRPFRFRATCTSRLRKRPGRAEFQRGVLERDEAGNVTVRHTGGQGSHMLSSMSQANCFIVLPVDSSGVEPGTEVAVEPFEGLV